MAGPEALVRVAGRGRWMATVGLSLAAALGACADPVTEVVVRIRADEGVAAAASRLELVIEADGRWLPEPEACDAGRCARVVDAPTFPLDVPISRPAGGRGEGFGLRVRWFRADGTEGGSGQVDLPFVAETRVVYELPLESPCAGVVCPGGSTCRAGRCEGSCVARRDGRWAAPIDCGLCGRCLAGACQPVPDGSACGDCGDHLCSGGECAGRNVYAVEVNQDATCFSVESRQQLTCLGDPEVVAAVGGAPSGAITGVALGEAHRCIDYVGSPVRCAGLGDDGQLGPLTAADPFECVPVERFGDCSIDPPANPGRPVYRYDESEPLVAHPEGSEWVRVEVGDRYSCAADSEGRVWCWGSQREFRTGGVLSWSPCDESYCPPFAGRPQVTPISEDPGVLVRPDTLRVGTRTACALTDESHVLCWGRAFEGEAGVPRETAAFTAPFETDTGDAGSVDGLWVGEGLVCVRSSADHALWCRGGNVRGQLGAGLAVQGSDTFVRVASDRPWDAVALGLQHGCAIAEDDARLWCWGGHADLGDSPYDYPALGFASPGDANRPVQVPGVGWSSLVSAQRHTCAVRFDAIYCWGDNSDGQIDPRTSQSGIVVPRLVCRDRAATE